MTATTDAPGAFRHELVLHDGVDELVELMVPFVRDGAAAGDHVVVVGEPDFVRTLLACVPEVPGLRAVAEPPGLRYPGRELHRARQVLSQGTRSAAGVRMVNQMPAVGDAERHEWRRYEAAANVVLRPYRAWGKCAHDRAGMDPDLLAFLGATHPLVQTRDGRHASPTFRDASPPPESLLQPPPHPVEAMPPTVTVADPTPAVARRVVRRLAARASLSPVAQECVVLAAGETVTNARLHGRSPVRLRVWVEDPGRVTVAVTDAGPGPDPLVGLVPAPTDSEAGRGLWLVHLLLRDVRHRRDDGGYTVTFSVDDDAPGALAPAVAAPAG